MITNIVAIGNSRGVRIPKVLLEESGMTTTVKLKVKKGEIKIVPAGNQRKVVESLLLSEKALAGDWDRKEEDKAWESLQ